MKAQKRWTDQEVDLMISLVRDKKIAEAARELGRGKRSVDGKILELRRSGVKVATRPGGRCVAGFKKTDKPWSDGEVRRLLYLLPNMKIREVATLLGRGSVSVGAKITDLRLHGVTVSTRGRGGANNAIPFTPEMQKWTINAVHSGKSNREIAEHLGISLTPLYRRLVKLGCNQLRCHCWTAEEDEKLRALAGKMKSREVAAALGKSYHATRGHATALGISLEYRTPKPVAAPRAPRPKPLAKLPKVQKRTAAPRERGSLTPRDRRTPRRYVSAVNWCAHCNAPFVDTFEGRGGHRERLGHFPVARAA